MNTNDQSSPNEDNLRARQTPRTDAVMQDPLRDGNDLPELARTLETENSELRRERDEAREENAAMREAIQDASKVLQQAVELSARHACGKEYRLGKSAKVILAKLQPFTTPTA